MIQSDLSSWNKNCTKFLLQPADLVVPRTIILDSWYEKSRETLCTSGRTRDSGGDNGTISKPRVAGEILVPAIEDVSVALSYRSCEIGTEIASSLDLSVVCGPEPQVIIQVSCQKFFCQLPSVLI